MCFEGGAVTRIRGTQWEVVRKKDEKVGWSFILQGFKCQVKACGLDHEGSRLPHRIPGQKSGLMRSGF